MNSRFHAFVVIYTLELESLKRRLRDRIKTYREEYEAGSVSKYVFMENRALLENEMSGFDEFTAEVNKLDVTKYGSIEELRDGLNALNEKLCAEDGIARTAAMLAKRKADRIISYFVESDRADEEYFGSIGGKKNKRQYHA